MSQNIMKMVVAQKQKILFLEGNFEVVATTVTFIYL